MYMLQVIFSNIVLTHLMARDTSCHALYDVDDMYDDELLVVVVTAVVAMATVVTAW